MVVYTILQYTLYIIGGFLLFNCAYLLFFSLAGLKKIKAFKGVNEKTKNNRFCVLIPAYKADEVILETARVAVNHQYEGSFDVFVIADQLQPETIAALKKRGAGVIEVNFEKSTKGKALLTAMEILPQDKYDVAVVLDVDNQAGTDFLNEINVAFNAGYKVVQAHRTAKNLDSAFALLDGCNEEINNHIFRKGHFAVGMSSALIGSGMAFEFAYFKRLLQGVGETVGEDKEIDFRILKDGVKICYLDNVYVYDEKIENAKVFTNQRTRWISTQVEFFKKYVGEGFSELFKKGNIEFFDKVIQSAILPRTLLIGVLGLFFILSLFIPYGPSIYFWAITLLMLAIALLIALPRKMYNKRLWTAIVRLPYAIFCMAIALLKINKTKSSFMATPHKAKSVSSFNN